MAEEAIDYRQPAREALSMARTTIDQADPADITLIWATLGTGLAVMAAAGAIMSTGSYAIRCGGRVVAELAGIRAELAKVNEAIR